MGQVLGCVKENVLLEGGHSSDIFVASPSPLHESLPPMHRRPPSFSASAPVPDTMAGPYDFSCYHSETSGPAAGFKDGAAALLRYQQHQVTLLRSVFANRSSRGRCWADLVRSGLLMNPELDLQYLEDRGFTDLGGDVFTLGVEPKVRLAPKP